MSQENLEQRVLDLEKKVDKLGRSLTMMIDTESKLSGTINTGLVISHNLIKADIAHDEFFLVLKDELNAILKLLAYMPGVTEENKQKLLASVARVETFSERIQAELASLKSEITALKPPPPLPPPLS